MFDSDDLSRRDWLRMLGAGATLLGVSRVASARTRDCKKTAPQSEGPFYPPDLPDDKGADLTCVSPGDELDLACVRGKKERAKGEIIQVTGRITDKNGRPLEGERIEIWQADAAGHYNHPMAPKTRERDPNFQGWGRTRIKADGAFAFRTIKPPPYPSGLPGWMRPAHIHFKVHRARYTLTSQFYFEGDRYIDKDLIYLAVPRCQRKNAIAHLRDGRWTINIVLPV
ncbi:MAG: hypothetical protein HYY84_09495 [Deltaproteobacteria bacterium]|nr:hypothetical protein [Deltaproteobacteria bacterium]